MQIISFISKVNEKNGKKVVYFYSGKNEINYGYTAGESEYYRAVEAD